MNDGDRLTATVETSPGSGSLRQPDYWWYRARSQLLAAFFGDSVEPGERLLDVGSADGPSVDFLPDRIALDIDSRGLGPGGVLASALELPIRTTGLDAVAVLDVVEHFQNDRALLAELARALRPGGALLVAVPAYQWAYSEFDDRAGHHRRYTRRRLVRLVRGAGFRVHRSSYAFASTFPFFVADRLRVRIRGLGSDGLSRVPRLVERVLMVLTSLESRLLSRVRLPFGSSVFLLATRQELERKT